MNRTSLTPHTLEDLRRPCGKAHPQSTWSLRTRGLREPASSGPTRSRRGSRGGFSSWHLL